MKKHAKSIKNSLIMSGIMIAIVNSVSAVPCPKIKRDEFRDLCRHPFVGTVLGRKSGKVTIDGAMLFNDRGACTEKTSIMELIAKDKSLSYPGTVFKDPKGIICTYDIDGKIYVFGTEGVDLPQRPAAEPQSTESASAKKPKTFGGFDPTTGSPERGLQQVEIKETPAAALPPPSSQPPRRPPPPVPSAANRPPLSSQNN
jgi:hypothetical protein